MIQIYYFLSQNSLHVEEIRMMKTKIIIIVMNNKVQTWGNQDVVWADGTTDTGVGDSRSSGPTPTGKSCPVTSDTGVGGRCLGVLV